MFSRLLGGRLLKRGGTYQERILSTAPAAYWPLTDTSGTTALDISGFPGRNGTYVNNPALNNTPGPGPSMGNAPKFNGVNEYVNVFSTALRSAISGGINQYSMVIWCKVANSGVWTDGVFRRIWSFDVNGANGNGALKNNTSNQMAANAYHQSTAYAIAHTISSADWFCVARTIGGGTMRLYVNGAEITPATSGMVSAAGTWAAACLGAYSSPPQQYWSGWLAHAAVWDAVLGPDTISYISNAV